MAAQAKAILSLTDSTPYPAQKPTPHTASARLSPTRKRWRPRRASSSSSAAYSSRCAASYAAWLVAKPDLYVPLFTCHSTGAEACLHRGAYRISP